ncbi:MAG: Flp family type IVb pilin [Hyphomicrobiaceae bacterium]|nr:Flp family type IVb pilin [Hyphomicrobiaceae bacterium]
MESLRRYLRDERGATAIEYALIASLIFVVIVTAVTAAGQSLGEVFQRVADEVGKVT